MRWNCFVRDRSPDYEYKILSRSLLILLALQVILEDFTNLSPCRRHAFLAGTSDRMGLRTGAKIFSTRLYRSDLEDSQHHRKPQESRRHAKCSIFVI